MINGLGDACNSEVGLVAARYLQHFGHMVHGTYFYLYRILHAKKRGAILCMVKGEKLLVKM